MIPKINEIILKPVGIINTPFETNNNVPIQASAAKGTKGTVEIFPGFVAGLKDLDGFSHIILIYNFHLSEGYRLEVKPFIPDFDMVEDDNTGWLQKSKRKFSIKKSDGRFNIEH